MVIIDTTKKNTVVLESLKQGQIFRFNERIFIKLKPFYLKEDIADYFDEYYCMESVDECERNCACYSAFDLTYNCLTCFEKDTAVEIVEAELHLV